MKSVYLNAYTNKNLGDDLFLYVISKRYENPFYVISKYGYYNSDFSQNLYIINNPIKMLLNKILGKMQINVFDLRNRYLNSSDVCINIGGSIFMEDDNINMWKNNINKYMKKKDGNTYVIGSNIGPFTDKGFVKLLKNELFEACRDVCLRDRYSYGLVKKLKNVRYSPDIIFGLKEYCDINLNEETEEKIALISVINMKKRKKICSQEAYEQMLLKLIIKLINNGYKIKLMSFCKYENDEKTIKNLLIKLKDYRDKISCYYYNGKIKEALNEIAKCNIIFGSRFHANILGLVFNKNIIPMIYSDKTLNLLKDIDFEGSVIDLRNIDNIEFDNLKLDYKLNVDQLEKSSSGHFKKLDEILELKTPC